MTDLPERAKMRNALVRDKIPDKIVRSGEVPIFRVLSSDDYLPALLDSALSQVAEALAADMIDPRRAMGLLKALRFAKENLKDSLKDDNAHWHDTPYLTEDATAYDSFEADYGLPEDIDL